MHREIERVRGYEVNRLGEDGQKESDKKRVNNESIQKKRNRG